MQVPGRKVRIDTPEALRRAAEQVVRDAFHGRRQPADAAALVTALRDLAAMREAEPRA